MNDVNWGHQGRILNVFISSPDDVKEERRAVHDVLLEVNRTVGNRWGVTLQPKMWENFSPQAGDPMEAIRRQLADCDLFVMIFSRRFGRSVVSPEGEYKSGTEQEYDIACAVRKEHGEIRPQIQAFFKNIADEETLQDPGPELAKVLTFKGRVQQTLFYKQYSSVEAFRPMVKDCILEWLSDVVAGLDLDPGMDKRRSIFRRFFDVGAVHGKPPTVRIIYPPISKDDVSPRQDITHLLPYMVLEDFQAIHKLAKDLSLAGVDDVRAVSEDVYKDHVHDQYVNRVYICQPRNRTARDYLNNFPDRRFDIKSTTEHSSDGKPSVAMIKWKSVNGTCVTVRSPQSKYLLPQRKKKRTDWVDHAGDCYAVDFAVLAKFPDVTLDAIANASGLRAYFIFGIRGLGTWGAAWYIDHRPEDLIRHSSGIVHQQLLRVEYRTHMIVNVEDVSDCDQAYFDHEFDDTHISQVLSNKSADTYASPGADAG